VVIGIIAVLISVLLPTLGRARTQANSIKCASALRQLGQAHLMYLNEFKGTIVLPLQIDPNFSPSNVFWFQRLSVYFNKQDVRSSTVDNGQVSSVLRSCPEWEGVDNDANGQIDTDKIGYGMARRLRTPDSRTRYHAPFNAAITPLPVSGNGPEGSDATQSTYLPPYWKQNQISKASNRILFGDSRQSYLDPPVAGWENLSAILPAQSGDVGRHSRVKRVADANDPNYKNMRANYCFFDGHVETLAPAQALQSINSPQ
jgi:prepilin-type processing-associated H-X9-DG protein